MNSKIYLDFNQIKQDVKILSDKIINSYIKYDAIIAISGGGLLPARLLRNYLDIPIYCLNIKLYNCNNEITGKPKIIQWLDNDIIDSLQNKNILIVDDLDDTGSTLHYVTNFIENGYKSYMPIKYKNLGVAVLYNKLKNKKSRIDIKYPYYKVFDIDDKWVVFPWE